MSGRIERPFIVLGGGGHARVLLDLLELIGAEVLGVTTADGKRDAHLPSNVKVLGGDSAISAHAPAGVVLVNAVGFTRASEARKQVQEKFASRGYTFPALVHPRACISRHATLHAGCQIMAGAVVQTGAIIGAGAIINTRASVDHDCDIGPYAHIAPGVALSGDVTVGECALVGIGAAVIQGIRIGRLATVGAGSAVTENVADRTTVSGTPACPDKHK